MKNNLLNETFSYNGEVTTPTSIQLISYSSKGINTKTLDNWDEEHVFSSNETYWIRVDGLSEVSVIEKIAKHVELDFLLTQDILNVNHPSKIEEYETFVLAVLKYFELDQDNNYIPLQISIVLGSNYIITFCERTPPFLDEVMAAINDDVLHLRKRGSDYLMSVIIHSIIGNYTAALMELNDSLEDLEDQLLTVNTPRNMGVTIQSKRRDYIKFKKAILPLKDQYARLLRTNNRIISLKNKAFFNDVNDHLQFVLQNIEMGRELLTTLVDLYMSNNDLKMNDIMKRLTIVSTIFIPLTFLVGVWGMNFIEMPELKWEFGYLMAWAIMFIVGLIIFFYFKIKKWY